MPPTPEAPVAEKRDRYGRQIEEAFADAAKLAGSNLAPTEFYQQFLNKTLTAIDAPAGAVWLRTPQGFLQIACQVNLEKVGLESRRGGRQCHNEILRQVFQQAPPPRPVMLEPNGRLAPNPQAPPPQGAEGSGVPAANLTDYFALFAPIVTPEKQAFGVLEVFQDSKHDPRLYPTFLNYAFQMAGYASQYHQFTNARQASGMERTFTQVEQFARQIHGSLNPTEVAYAVANEGRKLIECDRLCVGVRHARRKVTVEAVSGADVVEKASTHVRRLRKLMEAVLKWGEPLTFKGEKEDGLPPDVSYALDEYLNESQPKLLVVQPIRDEREKDTTVPARSVLVLESFNPPEQTDPLIQRLDIVAKHAAPALYNAAQMKRVPLKPLWWPIARVQEGIGGKARFIGITVALLLAVAIAALAAPASAPPIYGYPLRMEAKGQLVPVESAWVFAPDEGIVKDIKARPGAEVKEGFPAVVLYSKDLEEKQTKLMAARNEAQAKYTSSTQRLADPAIRPEERMERQVQLNLAELNTKTNTELLNDLNVRYQAAPNRPGWFEARTPGIDMTRPRPGGFPKWTVLNDDRRDQLLGRTVRPNEPLLRVGILEGDWQVELKIPQRNVGQIMRAFADKDLHKTDAAGPYLDVDVLLASMPDTRYLGRLYKRDISAEAVPNKNEHDENEPVVTAYVKLNLKAEDFPEDKWVPRSQFVTGLEVRTRVRCGNHSVGYAFGHG
ncbi:MAG: hypothetical protein K2P78_03055, partial [Gemmataceae bacterium]|nr:hypothetical protein [Gemmataceae bacterium]